MNSLPRRAGRSSTAAGIVVLLVCLLVVGLVRSAIPDGGPKEYWVGPDAQGVAHTDDVTVELISLTAATSVRPDDEFSDAHFVAAPDAVLVLRRFRMTPHGDILSPQTQLRTSDGYSHEALSLSDFPHPSFHVGFSATTTFIYELPLDSLDGVIGIHGRRPDGLQPVAPLIVYELPADLVPGSGVVTVPAAETEPAR